MSKFYVATRLSLVALLAAAASMSSVASAAEHARNLPKILDPEPVASFTTASDGSIFRLTQPGAGGDGGEVSRPYVQLTKFSSSGKAVLSFGKRARTQRVAVGRFAENWQYRPIALPNGRSAVFGTLGDMSVDLYRGFALVVFDSHGRLDHRFGGDGVLIKRYSDSSHRAFLANSAIGLANGSIAVCGNVPTPDRGTMAVIRDFGISGRLDTNFGTGGEFRYPHVAGYTDRCERLSAMPEPTMFVLSYQTDAHGPGVNRVIRLTQAGAIDYTFGLSGITDLPGIKRHGVSLALSVLATTVDSQGRVIVSLTGDFHNESYVARLSRDGSLDAAFAGGQYAVVPFYARLMQQLSDGNLLLAGHRLIDTPWGDRFNLAAPTYGRLTDSGATDPAGPFTGYKSFTKLDGILTDTFVASGRRYYWGVRRIPKRSVFYFFPGPPSRPIAIP